MRKLFLVLAVVAALAVTGVASAAGGPRGDVACGPGCDPGGGWSGCKTIEASHSSSLWYVYSVRHAFRVSYCKSGGVITSIWGQTNYCDVSGIASCSPTVWFQTGGGRPCDFAHGRRAPFRPGLHGNPLRTAGPGRSVRLFIS